MNSPHRAGLARRLFGSVRREGPSDELRARILAAGRAELELAPGGSARDAPRSVERAPAEGPERAAARRPERATRGRRWVALGALAAAAAALVYLGAEWAPERGVMISAERTGLPAPAAPAVPTPAAPAPAVPTGDEAASDEAASDEAVPSPPQPRATLRDDGAPPSDAKRSSPEGVRQAPELSKPERTKLEPANPDTGTPPSAEAPRASLGEQLEQIKRARAALRAGDHERALELIDAYRGLPTGGELGAEASLLRIEALALSGQRDAAAREARQFASDYPNSPLIDRALSYAAGAER